MRSHLFGHESSQPQHPWHPHVHFANPLTTISQDSSLVSSRNQTPRAPHLMESQSEARQESSWANLAQNESKSNLSSFHSKSLSGSSFCNNSGLNIPQKTKAKSPEGKKYQSESEIVRDWRINIMKNKGILSKCETSLLARQSALVEEAFDLVKRFFSRGGDLHLIDSDSSFTGEDALKIQGTIKLANLLNHVYSSHLLEGFACVQYSGERDLFSLSNTLNNTKASNIFKREQPADLNKEEVSDILEIHSYIASGQQPDQLGTIERSQDADGQQTNSLQGKLSEEVRGSEASISSPSQSSIRKRYKRINCVCDSESPNSHLYVSIQALCKQPKEESIHMFGSDNNFLKLESGHSSDSKGGLSRGNKKRQLGINSHEDLDSSSKSSSQEMSLKQQSNYGKWKPSSSKRGPSNKVRSSNTLKSSTSNALSAHTFNYCHNNGQNPQNGHEYYATNSYEDLSNIIMNMNRVNLEGLGFGTSQHLRTQKGQSDSQSGDGENASEVINKDLTSTVKLSHRSSKNHRKKEQNAQSQKIVLSNRHNNLSDKFDPNSIDKVNTLQKGVEIQSPRQSQIYDTKLIEGEMLPIETHFHADCQKERKEKSFLPNVKKADSPLFLPLDSTEFVQHVFKPNQTSKNKGQNIRFHTKSSVPIQVKKGSLSLDEKTESVRFFYSGRGQLFAPMKVDLQWKDSQKFSNSGRIAEKNIEGDSNRISRIKSACSLMSNWDRKNSLKNTVQRIPVNLELNRIPTLRVNLKSAQQSEYYKQCDKVAPKVSFTSMHNETNPWQRPQRPLNPFSKQRESGSSGQVPLFLSPSVRKTTHSGEVRGGYASVVNYNGPSQLGANTYYREVNPQPSVSSNFWNSNLHGNVEFQTIADRMSSRPATSVKHSSMFGQFAQENTRASFEGQFRLDEAIFQKIDSISNGYGLATNHHFSNDGVSHGLRQVRSSKQFQGHPPTGSGLSNYQPNSINSGVSKQKLQSLEKREFKNSRQFNHPGIQLSSGPSQRIVDTAQKGSAINRGGESEHSEYLTSNHFVKKQSLYPHQHSDERENFENPLLVRGKSRSNQKIQVTSAGKSKNAFFSANGCKLKGQKSSKAL